MDQPATQPPATTLSSTVVIMTTGGGDAVTCKDDFEQCAFWARIDECNINPDWMSVNCKMTCNTCNYVSETPTGEVTGPPVTAPESTTHKKNSDKRY